MKRDRLFFLVFFLLVSGIISFLSGCATVPEAIENRKLYVGAKMEEPMFLDPIRKRELRTIYVEVNNTSQLEKFRPEVLKKQIEEKLAGKGYRIVNDPREAGYIVQVNARYFDFFRKTGTKEGAATGAVAAGAGTLAATGADDTDDLIIAAVAATAGHIGGAFVGSMISINTFAGVVDLQILERAPKPITQEIQTNLKQGTSTSIKSKEKVQTNYRTYRNRIAVTAVKTNLKEEEASPAIMAKLAHEIAGFF